MQRRLSTAMRSILNKPVLSATVFNFGCMRVLVLTATAETEQIRFFADPASAPALCSRGPSA